MEFAFEFNSKTWSPFEGKKLNLFMRCVVVIMVTALVRKWRTRPPNSKFFMGSHVINEVSAHILEKYLHINPNHFSVSFYRLTEKDYENLVHRLVPEGEHNSKPTYKKVLEKWINSEDTLVRYQKMHRDFRSAVGRKFAKEYVWKEYEEDAKFGFTHIKQLGPELFGAAVQGLQISLQKSEVSACKICAECGRLQPKENMKRLLDELQKKLNL